MIRLRWRIIGLCFLVLVSLLVSGCFGLWSGGTKSEGPVDVKVRNPSPTGRYVIVFKENAIPPEARTSIEALGAKILAEFAPIGVLVAYSADPDFPNQALSIPEVLEIGADPIIELPELPDDPIVGIEPPADPVPVEPLGRLQPSQLPIDQNVLYVRYQWDIKRVGGVEATWLITMGEGVTVAVLDTGVYSNRYPGAIYHPDYPTHPDIEANLAYGKSFVNPEEFIPYGYTPLDDGTPQDYYGHGTHVAGAIAATMYNGLIIGVAPAASIANYKVLATVQRPDGSIGGSGFSAWIIAGLMAVAEDAAAENIRVANMSLGGAGLLTDPEDLAWYLAYCRAAQYAWEKGVLVVASAGNSALDWSRGPWRRWPGMAPATLAVTATGPDDKLAFYSDYGAFNADFTGPGGSIPEQTYPYYWYDWYCLSSWSPVSQLPGFWGARWVFSIGTSMAAPKVSGVATLVFAKNPGITPSQVVRILERTAEDLGAPGFDFEYGWGLAHAYRALTQ